MLMQKYLTITNISTLIYTYPVHLDLELLATRAAYAAACLHTGGSHAWDWPWEGEDVVAFFPCHHSHRQTATAAIMRIFYSSRPLPLHYP